MSTTTPVPQIPHRRVSRYCSPQTRRQGPSSAHDDNFPNPPIPVPFRFWTTPVPALETDVYKHRLFWLYRLNACSLDLNHRIISWIQNDDNDYDDDKKKKKESVIYNVLYINVVVYSNLVVRTKFRTVRAAG